MSTCDTPAGEFVLSINGYDELAITKAFDADLQRLMPRKDKETGETIGGEPFRFLRALVFVHQRREGLKDREAFAAAQELSIGQLNDYFADEAPADLDPDDPDTPAGKEPSPAG